MKRRRSSSSSSDEDMPLKRKRHSYKQHKLKDKDGLFVRSVEKCEFCDEVFYNKYSMLVHNAKHIIIPLLRQSLEQCTECSHCCNSLESLEWHMLQKHPHITNNVPELLESFTKKEPLMILLRKKVDTNKTSNELLRSFVCKEPITLLTKNKLVVEKENELVKNSPLQCFVQKEAVTLLEPLDVRRKDLQVVNDIINISDDSDDDNDNDTINDDNQTSDGNHTYNNDNETYNDAITDVKNDDSDTDANDMNVNKKQDGTDASFTIKDRIMFEEDEDVVNPNGLMNDLTTGCKVNLQLVNRHPSQNVGSKIILGSVPNYESVHYDDLVKPGVYRCKKCHVSFPNRYKEIIHEATHINIKNRLPFLCRLCDWYVSTSPWGLKRHIHSKHPGRIMPVKSITKCRKCGLNYIAFYKHMRNYHDAYICYFNRCKKYFESEEEIHEHRKQHRSETTESVINGEWYSKTVNMCDICYAFMRNKVNQNYEVLGTIDEVGVKHRCKVCKKKFFSINIVKMTARKHKTRTAMYLHDRKKLVTNKDRLKMVQQRLKKLKLMNKY